MAGQDLETRGRVLAAGTRLFAADGFKRVTVREICRKANANIAAVNYHFGGKQGLYEQVLRQAIETMRGTTDAARAAGEGHTAEDRLRLYIRVFLQRVAGKGVDTWIHQLMSHEMADPTPALDLVVEQVIRPRMAYLRGLVAEILGVPVEDPRVEQAVMSVQAQCHTVMTNPVSRRLLPDFRGNDAAVEQMADHIAAFSIGGIRALK